jgi:catechol 2,3-dioxygenase-like lactoylglutathione lyase family enzyme
MRTQPLLVVRDVQASSRFYQRLLGCTSGHGGDEYERLFDPKLHHTQYASDGLILQLHAWEVDHHHGPMADATQPLGNGVLLWFEIDDFDAAAARATELGAPVVRATHYNPNPDHRELWLKDLDGYTVVIASVDGDGDRP